MNGLHRLLAPTALICAFVLVLAFAATAAAETLSGEGTSPVNNEIPGKADILSATATYDSTAGTVSFNVTTREAPGEREELQMVGALGRPKEGVCSINLSQITLPVMEIILPGVSPLAPTAEPIPSWLEINEGGKIGGFGPATKSLNGTTSTLSAKSTELLVNKPYTCAVVAVEKPGSEKEAPKLLDELSFPLNIRQAAPSPPKPSVPTPGALSLARSKPLKLNTGKWTNVKVKVSNTGGTAVGPISIKAKAPAGVVLKPGSGKLGLPSLLSGQTWTVTLRVKLTEKAKSKSTLLLTATATGLSATGSVVVKSTG
jgi:hypothetical protein